MEYNDYTEKLNNPPEVRESVDEIMSYRVSMKNQKRYQY